MSVAHDSTFGPYTAEDLHALPDEGKTLELGRWTRLFRFRSIRPSWSTGGQPDAAPMS